MNDFIDIYIDLTLKIVTINIFAELDRPQFDTSVNMVEQRVPGEWSASKDQVHQIGDFCRARGACSAKFSLTKIHRDLQN